MLFGVFHGDLHGGNLFVMADGRVALLDYGITGRLDERRRLAFLRLLMGGTINDVRMQLGALVDLGALPRRHRPRRGRSRDLGLDRPAEDPTTMSADELVQEIRELTKSLLGYGARLPKELMLFVKDMLFLDGAIATLAPDVDLLRRDRPTSPRTSPASTASRSRRDVGVDPRALQVDLDGVRASMGLTNEVESITARDLQRRRQLILKRMGERRGRR